MGNTYSREILQLTETGLDAIVSDLLNRSDLSPKESLREAVMQGFLAAGGSELVIKAVTDEHVVVGYVYEDEQDDSLTEPTDDQIFPDLWSQDARAKIQQRVDQGYEG